MSLAVVAVVPAYNEARTVGATVDSLSPQVDRVVVVADNCTDDTAQVARAHGAQVLHTVGNHTRKAGALNQALGLLLPRLEVDDHVLLVDADSVLCADWADRALAYLSANPSLGAVSGAYMARPGRGVVALLQRAEYAQERRRISRRGGRVDVLSGTAMCASVSVLREVAATRPAGNRVYDESSLTEDFEVTLAIQALGYTPRSFKDLRVETEVMQTWADLYRQRLRWQRGTLETLAAYGWARLTRRLWATQALMYSTTFILVLLLGAWSVTGGTWQPWWLLIVPIFAVDQLVTAWAAGIRSRVLAVSLLPMWLYDLWRVCVYWVALSKALRRTAATWR